MPSQLAIRSLQTVPGGEQRFVLKNLFDFLNEEIFNNGLPTTTRVRWSEDLTCTFGLTSAACRGRAAGHIRLNKRLLRDNPSRDLVIDVLLHEMIHEVQNNWYPEDGHHGVEFVREMERINAKFGRHFTIEFDSPFCDRALERMCIHRWRCSACEFVYKRTRNVRGVPGVKLAAHTATGCVGDIKKLTPQEALADIKSYCDASQAKEMEDEKRQQ